MDESKRGAPAAKAKATTEDVRRYWEENPLFSLEVGEGYGEDGFYEILERIKFEDTEVYSLPYWNFAGYAGKKVLDIGCGPGWYTVQYARGGADVTAVDLTERAVKLASRFIEREGLANVTVRQGDAQALPFEAGTFDLVASSGVLHHAPDTEQTFREVRRVLKPGGEAKITLYYMNALLRIPLLFKVLLGALRLLGVRHHDVDSGRDPRTPEEFVRMYDGRNNPHGIALTDRQWREMFGRAGLLVEGSELHFFPIRFVRCRGLLQPFRKLLDARLGFLIYYTLRAPGA